MEEITTTNLPSKTKLPLNKYVYLIVAVILAICAWVIWNLIYCPVDPPHEIQKTINEIKKESSEYKHATIEHGETAKERSVSIYVQTDKDVRYMAPDAISDAVQSELRIFRAELAGSGADSIQTLP